MICLIKIVKSYSDCSTDNSMNACVGAGGGTLTRVDIERQVISYCIISWSRTMTVERGKM